MLSQTRLAFIGSGIMGEAIVHGILQQKLIDPERITCSDRLPRRVHELHSRYGVHSTTDNTAAAAPADVVVLSVKPQGLREVLAQLRGRLRPEQLVLSIVAGATTASISRGLEHNAVVRVMPNTPARVGQGMSVWTATPAVSNTGRERARAILRALGREIYVEREEELDMATALSGTGPAYVFLFMEALVDAGVHLGFPRRVAEELVLQTVKGSVEFAWKSRDHLAHLRNMVTSPGGTSAEALYQLEKGGMRTVLSRAVWAAYERSRQLSRLSEGE